MEQSSLEQQALAVIRSRRVSAPGLAAALGVSPRTAARAIAALRTRGHRVTTVRDGRRWYYALPGDQAHAKPDPLLGLVGFVRTGIRDGAVNHDHYLYGAAKKR
jgi:biotin operon repressor